MRILLRPKTPENQNSYQFSQAAGQMLALLIERQGASPNHLVEMRRVVELQAARWAAQRATDEDRAAIRGALGGMSAPTLSPECFAQADLAFHLAVARAAHSVVLFAMLSAVRGLLCDEIVSNLTLQRGRCYGNPYMLVFYELHYGLIMALNENINTIFIS